MDQGNDAVRKGPSTQSALLVLCLAGLVSGGLLHLAWSPSSAHTAWLGATLLGTAASAWWVLDGLRHKRFGTDTLALLALIGTLLVGEFLAGSIIAVMLTGGRVLEERAGRRARRDLSALLARSPTTAHRLLDGEIVTVPADDVRPGDLLLVRSGEVLPVDGRIEGDAAVLDESVVTGEPLPVERQAGEAARSGTVNAAGPFRLRATTDARRGTFAAIVRLAGDAKSDNAPFVRLADRYSAIFLPVSVVVAGVAWLMSQDPVRAVAVLVVATPCPLILAAPIAFTSGMSRCARRGVIVKSGAALERLARARVLLFDKTGTVTEGRPRLARTATGTDGSGEDVLRLAACLDQVSAHVLATAIVRAARENGLGLEQPGRVSESLGEGIEGVVGEHLVRVGKAAWAGCGEEEPPWVSAARSEAARDGSVTVFVGVDGRFAGVLLLKDRLRTDAPRTFRLLRIAGIDRTVMVTGDRQAVADLVGAYVGADEVRAEQSPEDKVEVVRTESGRAPTVMVGDGVNDAPALACAGVGVALGARGSTASSESADVVITVDRLARLAETLVIARRTRSIARESALVGMVLSFGAMLVAAAGLLPPTAGAVLQELIDVAVVVNALRALNGGLRGHSHELRGASAELVRSLDEEHHRLWPRIHELPQVSEAIALGSGEPSTELLDGLTAFLAEVGEHEERDEKLLYPQVDRALGVRGATAAMSRGHSEIDVLSRRIGAAIGELRTDCRPETRRHAARLVIELYAVLQLHFTQEEENYHVLATGDGAGKDR
ncbi:heavy metal translocating P-type ATPase [Nocardiopsis ansamitocini]|nr:heavy metal translocating P-type ATPase [Nocardiopsis ansamitocini]